MSKIIRPVQPGNAATYILVAYLLAALTMALWSGNWVIGRAVRGDVPPITLALFRWLAACSVLLPFAWKSAWRDWPVVRKHWKRMLGLGLSGAAIFHSFIYIGLKSTQAINGVLLNSMGPVIIILMAWIVVGDTITRRQAVGIAISFAGTVFLVSRGDLANLLAFRFNVGDIWILSAMFFWGIYSLLLRDRPREIGGDSQLLYTGAAAILFLAPASYVEYLLGQRINFSLNLAASIGYIGIFATVIAYICYDSAVRRIGPGQTGIVIYLLPVFGAAAAIVFLGEALRAYHLIGFAIILAGILLSTWRIRRSH